MSKFKKVIIAMLLIYIVGNFMECTGLYTPNDDNTPVSGEQIMQEQNSASSTDNVFSQSKNKAKITKDMASESLLYSRLYLPYQYASKYGIEFPYFPEQERIATRMTLKAYESNEWGVKVNIKTEQGFWEPESYIQTLDDSNLLYWGELNGDKQPNGCGVIFKVEDIYDPEAKLEIRYIGEFKNGVYDGYGALFVSSEEYYEYQDVYYDFYSELITLNSVKYEGYFNDGEPSGEGIEISSDAGCYNYSDYGNEKDAYLLKPGQINYDFKVGTFKKGECDGKIKLYYNGILRYEGECRKGSISGNGIEYFEEPQGKIKYKGEFFDGAYQGDGTLYDQNGEIIHKGKFANGDISS